MPNYVPVSQERHAAKSWKKPEGYAFALGLESVPLVDAEMAKAAGSLPIVFVRQGEKFVPAAMMGIGTGRNLFLTESGKWLGGYVPAALRAHPFRLGKTAEKGTVLCIDEESGLMSPDTGALPFFEGEGTPSAPVREMLNLLVQVERSREATEKAMDLLFTSQLIKPWPIKISTPNGEKTIQGLFQIDETALKQLSSDTLGPLNAKGALEIAYCQLVSRQHVSLLSQLVEAHTAREKRMTQAASNLMEPTESADIEVDWDRFKQK